VLHQLDYQFAQYKWLEADFAAVDHKQTPSLIVLGHRPMWPSPAHRTNGSSFEELLYRYRVDVTVAGHVHYAQHICAAYKKKCVSPSVLGVYDAPVNVVIGNGGQTLNNSFRCDWNAPGANCSHEGQSKTQGSRQEFGISDFTANATDLLWEFIGDNGSLAHHTLHVTQA
jgi:hypothetical protein